MSELRERGLAFLALADRASPGPWTRENAMGSSLTDIAAPDVPGQGSPNIIATCLCDEDDHDDTVQAIQNAAFIAASHEAAAIIRALLQFATVSSPNFDRDKFINHLASVIADTQRALGISDEAAACANGSDEIVEAIESLKAKAIKRKSANV